MFKAGNNEMFIVRSFLEYDLNAVCLLCFNTPGYHLWNMADSDDVLIMQIHDGIFWVIFTSFHPGIS